ncbi:MAG: hypothetical protein BWY64_04086 [bacterium ADurb.Bin363]|jgi:predicted nuclease of predicted toxin-antitoxin system|nr:MAG: hypothetical protein BWY64_04086 [bacterium ADurb.Bin363]
MSFLRRSWKKLRIVVDENVDYRIMKYLRNEGFNIISVLEDYRSISDQAVLSLAKEKGALILTEDKDFGGWVFSYKEKNIGIIFLRYKPNEIKEISHTLLRLLQKYGSALTKKFTVIRANKIRIRELL